MGPVLGPVPNYGTSPILRTGDRSRTGPTAISDCIYFRAMEDLFEQLTRCKDDEQQRNWMLYEDEVTIRDLLQVQTSFLQKVEL